MADFDEKAVVTSGSRDLSDPFSPEVKKAELIYSKGAELIEHLQQCPPGKDDGAWKRYQDLCEEILRYCLTDCFEAFDLQQESTTWDDHQRMDILVKNRPSPSNPSNYWQNILTSYKSQTILFECKNYTKGIKNSEVLQAKDYEIPEMGLFRIILTRKTPSSQGIRAIRHWWIYPPNMKIIVLTDAELIAMITAKMEGKVVEEVLFHAEDGERARWYR